LQQHCSSLQFLCEINLREFLNTSSISQIENINVFDRKIWYKRHYLKNSSIAAAIMLHTCSNMIYFG